MSHRMFDAPGRLRYHWVPEENGKVNFFLNRYSSIFIFLPEPWEEQKGAMCPL